MAGDRARCIVPFCGRTTARRGDEWICAGHWRLGDRRVRLRHKRWLRRRPGKPSPYWPYLKGQIIVRASLEEARPSQRRGGAPYTADSRGGPTHSRKAASGRARPLAAGGAGR